MGGPRRVRRLDPVWRPMEPSTLSRGTPGLVPTSSEIEGRPWRFSGDLSLYDMNSREWPFDPCLPGSLEPGTAA